MIQRIACLMIIVQFSADVQTVDSAMLRKLEENLGTASLLMRKIFTAYDDDCYAPKLHRGYEAHSTGGLRVNLDQLGTFSVVLSSDTGVFFILSSIMGNT